MINEANCGTYVPACNVAALKQEVERYAHMDTHEWLLIGARGKAWLLENRSYPKLGKEYLGIMLNTAVKV